MEKEIIEVKPELKPKRIKIKSWELYAAWYDNAVLKLLTDRIMKILKPKGEFIDNPIYVQFFIDFPESKNDYNEMFRHIENILCLWNLRRIELWVSNGVDFRPTELIWLRQSQRGIRAEFEIEKREPFTWDTVVKEQERERRNDKAMEAE